MKPRLIFTTAILLAVLLAQSIPQPAAAVTACDWAQFIADVTVPDGTSYAPGTAFAKTWRLKNIGTCTWSTSYSLVYVSGDKMGAASAVNLPSSVAPSQTVDLTVNMTAPASNGSYRGYWQLRNASGVLFGIGSAAKSSFWVDIKVAVTYASAYDFAANAASATWTSGAGALTFPGTSGDVKGYVQKLDAPKLENGVTDSVPGLLMVPQNITDGYIQGIYPEFAVQNGDRFQSIVNCEYNATGCYVTFRLDYQIGTGAVRTYWTFRERYEGLYYRVNLDLSSLAGQNVKFILYISAYGSPTGDKALWGAPRIVRAGAIVPTPTAGTPPTPTSTVSPTCDKAEFVADVSVPDGSSYSGGAAFTKTWRFRNSGSCTWTTSYNVVFVSGDAMGGTTTALPSSVAPGATVDVSVNLTAPTTSGHYKGYWKLRNASGTQFGIGATGTTAFWVDINVASTYATAYDFVANACAATWTSGAGTLGCPGTDGDVKGFILKLDTSKLEDGTTGGVGLLTHPQKITNGVIQGMYPAFTVQSGDRFQALINCEYNATSCYVTFRLDYQVGSDPVKTFYTFTERYEGMYYRVDVSLSPLAGQNVKFILKVLAGTYFTGDRALWVTPPIARP